MEEKRTTPPVGAPVGPCTPPVRPKRVYETDGKDRGLLFLAWALGVLLVSLLWGPGLPGLGVTLWVAAFYAVLFWYRGTAGFRTRENVLLFLAVAALALTFSIWSNLWLRGWNLLFLCGLMAVQLFQWSGQGRRPWYLPTMVPERVGLALWGLFGALPASASAARSLRGGKRTWTVLLGLALAVPLVALSGLLLLQADSYFALVVRDLTRTLGRLFGSAAARLALGVLAAPFLFGLLYTLRRGKGREEPGPLVLPGLDPVAPAVALGMLDLLYAFFLAVQSAALFGGPAYLERVAGLSYAEYARSGFFQLVFVAALNLTLVLTVFQVSRREGRGWRAAQLLSTAMIAMSCVMLVSAAYRMTLYVQVYGLSFKRFLTYWGMAVLAILFGAAAWKLWRREFSFFKVLLTVEIAAWLILNACNVDLLVAKYNVALWRRQESAVLDLDYLAWDLSYDALGALRDLPEDAPLSGCAGTVTLGEALERRQRAAALDASRWQTWSLSAFLAAGE